MSISDDGDYRRVWDWPEVMRIFTSNRVGIVALNEQTIVQDALHTLDDGHFKTGRITTATSERALGLLTNYAKQYAINIVVIGQVTKDGKRDRTLGYL